MDVTKLIPEYLKHIQALGYAPGSLKSARGALKHFTAFLHGEGITELEGITLEIIEEYQQEIAFSFTAQGRPLSVASQLKRLCVIKCFTRFLKEHDYLVHDPGACVKLPKPPKRLPRSILNEPEVKRLIAAPDRHTNEGYRDMVILELLYDTGIRRAEIAGIRLPDLDLDAGFLRIRGKGNKERVVPVNAKVCRLLRNYILAVRPSYIRGSDNGGLFLSRLGDRMSGDGIYYAVKRYAGLLKLKTNVTTHTLRHTCATHMLRNGAPVRHIQEMLGHESLETTQIYTHVTINDLKEVHAKYHPSSKEATP